MPLPNGLDISEGAGALYEMPVQRNLSLCYKLSLSFGAKGRILATAGLETVRQRLGPKSFYPRDF
jgi:hypothetical protein